MTVTRYKSRFWALYDEDGNLICVCLYRKGAREVEHRLTRKKKAQQRETRHVTHATVLIRTRTQHSGTASVQTHSSEDAGKHSTRNTVPLSPQQPACSQDSNGCQAGPHQPDGKKHEFCVPCEWKMYGHLFIEAETLEEAIEEAYMGDTALPTDGEFVDDSFWVDREEAKRRAQESEAEKPGQKEDRA